MLTPNIERLKDLWRIMILSVDFNLQVKSKENIITLLDSMPKYLWSNKVKDGESKLGFDYAIKELYDVVYDYAHDKYPSRSYIINRVYEIYDDIEQTYNNNRDLYNFDLHRIILLDEIKGGLLQWSETEINYINTLEPARRNSEYKMYQTMAEEEVKDIIRSIKIELLSNEITNAFEEGLSKFKSSEDIMSEIEATLANIETIKVKNMNIKDDGDIDMFFDFGATGIDEALQEAEKKLQVGKPISTGLVGVNGMLDGGFYPGEYVNIGALSHHFKSGLLTTLEAGMCLDNDWTKIKEEDGREPIGIHVSFEDSLDNYYRNIYEVLRSSNIYDEFKFDANTLDSINNGERLSFSILAKEVDRLLKSRGMNIITMKADPTKFSFDKLITTLNKLLKDGYNIKFVAIDYLDKLPDSNMGDNGVTGEAKRMKVRKIRNWGMSRGILTLSPWQLNSEISRYKSGGATHDEFLRYMASAGKYQGNSTLTTDIDTELFTYVFSDKNIKEGSKFLGISRGKRRSAFGDVDEKLKTIFYEFKNGMKPGLDLTMKSKSKPSHVYRSEDLRGSSAGGMDEIEVF